MEGKGRETFVSPKPERPVDLKHYSN